ncbi:hypothetical protein ACWCPG_12785, partial [Streptomyces sp. NPDC001919]
GRNGTSLAGYRERVARAYGDKLPGSAYAKKGTAGGYGVPGTDASAAGPMTGPAAAAEPGAGAAVASATAGAGAGLALLLVSVAAVRRRRATTREL